MTIKEIRYHLTRFTVESYDNVELFGLYDRVKGPVGKIHAREYYIGETRFSIYKVKKIDPSLRRIFLFPESTICPDPGQKLRAQFIAHWAPPWYKDRINVIDKNKIVRHCSIKIIEKYTYRFTPNDDSPEIQVDITEVKAVLNDPQHKTIVLSDSPKKTLKKLNLPLETYI